VYCAYYGLVRRPFEMTPDPAFLYLGETHREGLATLLYGVQSGKGFVLLTGEVGTGKTTLLHALLGQLEADTASAFLFNPRLEPLDFFRVLLDEYGIETVCRTKAEYLLALNAYLIQRLGKNLRTVLIIDEAQTLSPEMLEEVRLLSNLETPTSKLLQIVLVGQPELVALLARPELRQLRQRIVLRHQLRPFEPRETDAYVDERLALAGYTGKGIFQRSARRELHAVTSGIPRLVNVVCDGALLLGYARQAATLDAAVIREVAADLGLLEGAGGAAGAAPEPTAQRPQRPGWLARLRRRPEGGRSEPNASEGGPPRK
jgi:general secretion pathway protein A